MSETESIIVKHLTRAMRLQITGFILREEKPLWDEYKKRCTENKIAISYDGFSDMLKTYNHLNRVIFPLAKKLRINPIEFKDTMLDYIVETLEEMDVNKWDLEIGESQKYAKKQIKNKIIECLNPAIKST